MMEGRKRRGTIARRCETHVQERLEDGGRPGSRRTQKKDRGTLTRKCEDAALRTRAGKAGRRGKVR